MRYTQYLAFEITPHCNLGHIHDRCPNSHPERFSHLDTSRAVSDDLIVETAIQAHQAGFRGRVVWHHYCEPLMGERRMWRLMDALDAAVPGIRYDLWTNGTIWPRHPEYLSRFARIILSDYRIPDRPVDSHKWSSVKTSLWYQCGNLDGRITVQPRDSGDGCWMMFTEFIVDYYGNVKLCCNDWRGLGSPGNLNTEQFSAILERWLMLRGSMIDRMGADSPAICRSCGRREKKISGFDMGIAEETRRLVAERIKP